MLILSRILLPASLVLLLGAAPAPALPTPADAPDYRIRLVPPPAARPGSDWIEALAAELGSDLGVTVEPSLPAPLRHSVAARTAQPTGIALAGLARWARVPLPAGDEAAVLERLSRDPRVDRIEPVALGFTAGLVSDDPLLRNQEPWLELVGLPAAWAVAEDPAPGPVAVAIIDGGTDWQHPDLLANLATNEGEIPDDGIDQDGNGYVDDLIGWNFPADEADPSPLPGQDFNARHGTHVAGTVGAVLGNGIGIAGAGGNPRLILVNAAHPEIDGGIAYGYEGILYAVARGARVINCSWRTVRVIGGQKYDAPYSEFEALVLAVAREAGALVLAAAGNDSSEDLWTTPAGYPDALAVGATDFTEAVPWSLGNRGPWVELFAPGQTIVSTIPRWMPTAIGPYAAQNGTSMATAVASGVAALIAGQRPEWTLDQLRSRLVWTGEEPDALGGARLVRADLALFTAATPDVALRLIGPSDADADGLAEGGEIVDLRFGARSLFASQPGVKVEAFTDDPWLVSLIPAIGLPRVPADHELDVVRGIRMWVHPEAPPGHVARVQLRATSGGVVGPRASGTLILRPLTGTLANKWLRASASANGMLGEASLIVSQDPVDPALARADDAYGFLQHAALVLGTGPGMLSHAMVPRAPGLTTRDFYPLEDGLARQPGPGGDGELRLRYSDRHASASLGVNVTQTVRLLGRESGGDFVIVEYEIAALGMPLTDLRWGLALDWSVPARDPLVRGGYVAERLSGIDAGMRVEAAEPGTGAGVAGARILATPADVGLASIARWQVEEEPGWNLPGDPAGSPDDALLWPLLQRGRHQSLDRTGDRVGLLSCGLGSVEEGERVRVVVALGIADDSEALEELLERARLTWETARVGLTPESMGTGFVSFSQNPFRSGTEASFVLAASGPVLIEVFDLRGRRVRTLLDGGRDAGVHRVSWDGRDRRGADVASGVYLLRLSTPGATSSRAITRVR